MSGYAWDCQKWFALKSNWGIRFSKKHQKASFLLRVDGSKFSIRAGLLWVETLSSWQSLVMLCMKRKEHFKGTSDIKQILTIRGRYWLGIKKLLVKAMRRSELPGQWMLVWALMETLELIKYGSPLYHSASSLLWLNVLATVYWAYVTHAVSSTWYLHMWPPLTSTPPWRELFLPLWCRWGNLDSQIPHLSHGPMY
jgi:hypothetical protein